MKLLVKAKGLGEGLLVGYGPGKKGKPLGMIIINGKIHAVKLRSLEVIGWAKLKEVSTPFTSLDGDQPAIH